jgi:hypothetical protein
MESRLVSRRAILRACAAACLQMRADAADPWPAKPIRLVVPLTFGALIGSEIARWKPVVERANMKPD